MEPGTNKTSNFFQCEVYKWRGYAAQFLSTAWLVISCIFCLFVHLFTSSVIAKGGGYGWRIPYYFTMLVVIVLAYTPLCRINIQRMTVHTDGSSTWMKSTRWTGVKHFLLVLSSIFFYIMLAFGFVGLFQPYLLHVSKPCVKRVGDCVHDDLMFLFLHCALIGLISSCRLLLFGQENVMSFSYLPLRKLERLRVSVFPLMVDSFLFVIRFLPLTSLLLIVFGQGYISICGYLFGIWFTEEWSVFSWQLLLRCLFFSSVIRYVIKQFIFTFQVYQTDPLPLKIGSNFENDCYNLAEALQSKNTPLLQFLGYHQLDALSAHSFVAREELFSLSAVGGHPHNWRIISGECVTTMKELFESIQQYNKEVMVSSGIMKQQMANDAKTNKQADVQPSVFTKKKTSLWSKVFSSTLWVFGFTAGSNQEKGLQQIKRKSPLYFWCIKALANIVESSYSEDKFGVVQRDLADIVQLYVSTYEESEKLFRLVCGVQRGVRPHDFDWLIFNNLRALLKSCIYQLTNKFQSSILDVPYSSVVEKKLRLFLDHRV